MHIAVLLWGFTGVLGRAIELDAPVLVWYRMLMTAVIIAVIIQFRKQWVQIEKKDLVQLSIVGGLMGLHWVAFYGAIKFANASIALVCLSTTPVFTTLFNFLVSKTKYEFKELLLGGLALLGMFLIYQFQQLYVLGITLGIIAAVLAALFTVLNKRIAHKYPARPMVFYEMASGLIFISLLMPFQLIYFPETNLTPTLSDLLWLVVLSLCCTVWAQSLALDALKHISSFTATLSVNLEPVYGILLAFLIYKENAELHAGFYLGMGLILLSVILQMLRLLKPLKMSPGFIKEKGGIE